MTHHIDLDTLILAHGSHEDRDDGVCLLEAVAWWAGETHTDHPACVSPVLGAFGRPLNDAWPDGKRQELRPLIPLLPGTAGDGHDEARGYLALDWLIRTYTPAWLELAGLTAEADALRGLQPVADMPTAEAAGPAVRQARQKADAAGVAARDAAWVAARDAAWAAAGAAARDAARDAARAKLAPTVTTLQDSAIILFRAMITCGEKP